MANTYADLPRDIIKDTSIFKNIVAGDTMNAERVSASTMSGGRIIIYTYFNSRNRNKKKKKNNVIIIVSVVAAENKIV
jgi:hypothetical protein